MKNLFTKKLGLAALAAIIISTCIFIGCASTPGGTGGFDLDKAQKTSIILKSTARSAVFYAASQDSNAPKYLNLAIESVNKFLIGTNLSPDSLQTALRGIPIKELRSVEAQIAINAIDLTYELFWSDWVKQKIASNEPLLIVLTGLRDGLVLAQEDLKVNPPQVVRRR